MEHKDEPDEVFVVRLWRESGHTGTGDDAWRGRLKRVTGGSTHHFVGLVSLFALLRRLLPPGIRTEQTDREKRLDVH